MKEQIKDTDPPLPRISTNCVHARCWNVRYAITKKQMMASFVTA